MHRQHTIHGLVARAAPAVLALAASALLVAALAQVGGAPSVQYWGQSWPGQEVLP